MAVLNVYSFAVETAFFEDNRFGKQSADGWHFSLSYHSPWAFDGVIRFFQAMCNCHAAAQLRSVSEENIIFFWFIPGGAPSQPMFFHSVSVFEVGACSISVPMAVCERSKRREICLQLHVVEKLGCRVEELYAKRSGTRESATELVFRTPIGAQGLQKTNNQQPWGNEVFSKRGAGCSSRLNSLLVGFMVGKGSRFYQH